MGLKTMHARQPRHGSGPGVASDRGMVIGTDFVAHEKRPMNSST